MVSHGRNSPISDTLVRLLRRNATKNLAKILGTLRPEDIALAFRKIGEGRWKQLFELIPTPEDQAETLTELDDEILEPFLDQFSDAELAPLLGLMSSDDAADVLHLLPEERAAALVAKVTPENELSEAVGLMGYDPETAGGLMVPTVLQLPAILSVGEAIAEIQRRSDELEMVFYLYVVNEPGHLVGVCSLRDLVTSPPEVQLADIMETNVIRVTTDTDQEEVARIVARYNLLAVPVVDESNKLVGTVTVDDIIDVIREEATEDILRMAGVSDDVDVSERRGVFSSARARIPWLLANFTSGSIGMFLISSFEHALESVALLAAFLPITLGMGGNVGTQSATIVTRGLALGRIEPSRMWRIVFQEVRVGLLCGLTYGAIGGVVVGTLFQPNVSPIRMAFSVGLSMLTSMTIAASMGGLMPLVFQRFHVDPAIAAGPFVATSVDVLGILAYFLIASALLGL